jgi:DNA-binding response OmpR family regulator
VQAKAVLLIESDRPLREAMAHALAVYGYQVQTARDMPEGVAKIREGEFDVVVADAPCLDNGGNCVLLGPGDGEPGIPVICISDERRASFRDEALEAGASAYLIKPITAAALHSTIEEVLLQV